MKTIFGTGMEGYAQVPRWTPPALLQLDAGRRSKAATAACCAAADEPFRADGGLRMLEGNLGRAVIKVSSVPDDRLVIEAPAIVFHDQDEIAGAFKRGELNRDFVAVVRFQGPQANGMPELHKLTPTLALLQDRGHRIALLTDGRMSGASGRVPAAIHVTPEAVAGGNIAKIRNGDLIRLDAVNGRLDVLMEAMNWTRACPSTPTFRPSTAAWVASCSACSARPPPAPTSAPACSEARSRATSRRHRPIVPSHQISE